MLKIIRLNKKDFKRVGQFGKTEWHKLDREHYGEPNISYIDKKFHYVAREDEEIIGTIKGTYELGVVYISSLIVAEKRRGQGVGKALLAKVARRGKNLGCHKCETFTKNTISIFTKGIFDCGLSHLGGVKPRHLHYFQTR